ncbi:MAG: hypothetical protein NWE94_10290 [Candidatus Bathyarchaeota archaeon]|nr:hypothetical protein [Candidatus Bathyarchaeota archaeon]
MKPNDAKAVTKAVNELSESYSDLAYALHGAACSAEATKKLWRAGNKSRLIKIGVALIVFPDPSPITECVGACFVAAGAVQQGIRSRALFLEDVGKTFKDTLRGVRAIKDSL